MKEGQRISSKLKKWFQLHPQWDAETKQDKLDIFIMKIFPVYVTFFFFFAMLLFFTNWGNHQTVGHFMYSLCCSYAAAFIILGIPVICLSEHSIVRNRYLVLLLFAVSTVIGLFLWNVFGNSGDSVNTFVSGFYWFIGKSGLEITLRSVIIGIWVLLIVMIFASYGVIAVVVAYFRNNYHRILAALERNDDSKFCVKARNFFLIPSVIDISEVTLDPEISDEKFHKNIFVRIFLSELLIGTIIASYLFLNPVFLKSIPYAEMMVIMLLLSVFVAPLVIPVHILRSLGARAHSEGNRPFPLWEGMKNRMFHPSFYVALFFTLLWISIYTDMDGLRIIAHYTGYIMFMICQSFIVALIYVNTFYVPFKNGIIRNFYKNKKKKE